MKVIKKVQIEQNFTNGEWKTNELENSIENVSYDYYTKFIGVSKFFNSKVKTEYASGKKYVTDFNTCPTGKCRIVTQFTIDL